MAGPALSIRSRRPSSRFKRLVEVARQRLTLKTAGFLEAFDGAFEACVERLAERFGID